MRSENGEYHVLLAAALGASQDVKDSILWTEETGFAMGFLTGMLFTLDTTGEEKTATAVFENVCNVNPKVAPFFYGVH